MKIRGTSTGAPRFGTPRSACAARGRCRLVAPQAFFGGGKKGKSQREIEREEQWKAQQDIIARRKDGSWQKKVLDRRAEVRKYVSDPTYKEKVDSERRERRKRENPDPPVNPFSIIIPLPPFGMPEYDDGERFDLRSPYAEKGYVDPEAAVGKQLARFFGFGKKKEEEDGDDSKGKDKKSK